MLFRANKSGTLAMNGTSRRLVSAQSHRYYGAQLDLRIIMICLYPRKAFIRFEFAQQKFLDYILNAITKSCVVPNVWTLYTPFRYLHSFSSI